MPYRHTFQRFNVPDVPIHYCILQTALKFTQEIYALKRLSRNNQRNSTTHGGETIVYRFPHVRLCTCAE